MEKRNLSWDKNSPAWLYGTEDTLLADYETKSTELTIQEEKYFRTLNLRTFLDYGAGSGFYSHRLFPQADRFDFHPTPEAGVQRGDILKDPIEKQYDLVHARRLVSNLEGHDRNSAVWRLFEAVKPGGLLVLCDTWEPARQNINALRAELDLSPLPSPKYGQGGLSADELPEPPNRVVPVAVDYYLWTRVFFEAQYGFPCPFSNLRARQIRPAIQFPGNGLDYAVHRILVWRKP
jgi:SAM-dependent methyltransferase